MKRTLALTLTVLMVLTLIPASLLNVLARGPGVAANATLNQTIPNADGQFIPETVVVDGVVDDTAWESTDWQNADSETGTWNIQYPEDIKNDDDPSTPEMVDYSYRYQIKADYYFLYGVIELPSVPAGVVTLYLTDGSTKANYTDVFTFDVANKTFTRKTADGTAINDYSEYAFEKSRCEFVTAEDGSVVVEFKSLLRDFCENKNPEITYIISVDVRKNGESFYSLYHPAIEIDDVANREQYFPSLTNWPASGAQVVTRNDVIGNGDLSMANNNHMSIDGNLNEALWAAQTEFYHKWYERTPVPSWYDNLQGGSVANNKDENGDLYKDFADISSNVLPYNETYDSAAKYDLYVTGNFIYGAALVHDGYEGASENTVVTFYIGEGTDAAVRIDLRYQSDDEENTYGYTAFSNHVDSIYTNPGSSSADVYYWDQAMLGIDGESNYYFDNSMGQYVITEDYNSYYATVAANEYANQTTENPDWYPDAIKPENMGLMYSSRPAGPNLYVFEFAIHRSYIDKQLGYTNKTFVPSNYAFEVRSETAQQVSSYSASSEYWTYENVNLPRYFKSASGEFYEPYTTFTPDATLGERAWPGILASADNVVNGSYFGETERAAASFMTLLRGDLEYVYGSVVLEVGDEFGESWVEGGEQNPGDGDLFVLWLEEDAAYTDGVYGANKHRFGIWMYDGKPVIGSHWNKEGTGADYYAVTDGSYKVAIKKYSDSRILEPKYETPEIDGNKTTPDYESAYNVETHDYYVIEFAIPWNSLGYPGKDLIITDAAYNNEAVASEWANRMFFYHTSMHFAPTAEEAAAGNETGRTILYPRTTDFDETTGELTAISYESAYTYYYPHIFGKHDVFFSLNIDGKIIEEQRVPLRDNHVGFTDSEYRTPAANGGYLDYSSMLYTGREYTFLGAIIDGNLATGSYSATNKTMVTLWIKDVDASGNQLGIYKYEFFNDGSADYVYENGVEQTDEWGKYYFSSANGETYFEAGIRTDWFDPDLNGYEYFIEVTQVVENGTASETLSRVTPKTRLPEIAGYADHFALQGADWAQNAVSAGTLVHFLPDEIVVDGNLTDIGWRDDWTFVSQDINASSQETNADYDRYQTQFYYQMRMDEDYLYVGAIIEYWDDTAEGTKTLVTDTAEISKQDPGFRVWIKSGTYGQNVAAGQSVTYTDYYDIRRVDPSDSGNGTVTYSNQVNTFPTFASNTRPFFNKFYQYVNPDNNGDGRFTSADYIIQNGQVTTNNTVVTEDDQFATATNNKYGETTLMGETKVSLNDDEGLVVGPNPGQTKGEMVDNGAIIDYVNHQYSGSNETNAQGSVNVQTDNGALAVPYTYSTGVEAGVMKFGADTINTTVAPAGFSDWYLSNRMPYAIVVEFKVDLDEFGGRDQFEYYVSAATHPNWAASKTTMYPAVVSDPGSGSNYFHVNYPFWKWTDEHSIVVDEALREHMTMRTYKKPVTTLGAKVNESYSYRDEDGVLHENVNAIRFGGLWNEEYIRKVNGLQSGELGGTDGYTKNSGTTDDWKIINTENGYKDETTGNYTDYWDVEAMGIVLKPTPYVEERTSAVSPDLPEGRHDQYQLYKNESGAAWLDADGIVNWVGGTTGYPDTSINFADYTNFAFYITLVNVPTNMPICFRGFVDYYDDPSGATSYYDVILERSINMVVDKATNSTGNEYEEDGALNDHEFTDGYYKPGTGAFGGDKVNPKPDPDPDDPDDPVDPDPDDPDDPVTPPDTPTVGDFTIDYANTAIGTGDRMVILANDNYTSWNTAVWWNKVLLEYDDNAGNYKVIATVPAGTSLTTAWDYGIDRVILASHDSESGDEQIAAEHEFVGSLAVGDRVNINGTTLAGLKAASDAITGVTVEKATVVPEKVVIPEINTAQDLGELIPNATNGEKVAYVPLDNRPVHKERVQYQAAAAGINLVMPSEADYATVLTDGEEHGGNPANILAWLKEQETAGVDYYVIALDQVFSGGLVASREGSACTTADGSLSEQDKAAVTFLVNLAKENYVVYTDTIIRLAMTTSGYINYGSNDDRYYALRNYGLSAREKLGTDGCHALTLDNVISAYRYGADGVTKVSYTTYGGYTVTESELDALLNARERKLRITDAIIKGAGDNIDRLIIGLDDTNAENHNIQSNERAYIEQLARDYEMNNMFTIAGCDEMGLMGIASLVNDVYLGNDGVVIQFVTSGDTSGAADAYDSGSLSASLIAHMNAIGVTRVQVGDAGTPDIKIFVLGRDGDSAALVSQIKECLDANTGVAIIDASKSGGEHNNVFLNAMISGGVFDREDAGEILGFSHWNTVGNLVGISMSNAISRYAYLKATDETTTDADYAFLRSLYFSYIKDCAYKPHQVYNDTSWVSTYAWPIMNYMQGSFVKILGKDAEGNITSVDTGYNNFYLDMDNVVWPWGRNFECMFDLYFQYV